MGVVSYLEDDRKVVREWFDAVLLGAGCRSVCSSVAFEGRVAAKFCAERSTSMGNPQRPMEMDRRGT
jgi:hypothetical protein